MKELKRARSPSEQVQLAKKNKTRRDIVLYFDVLPENALENVVRFFSDFPRSKDWSRHVGIDNMPALCRVSGELSTFICSRFNALCIADLHNFSFEADLYRWDQPMYHVLWTHKSQPAREFIQQSGGKSFHTLTIRDPTNTVNLDFLDACTQVRSLSVARYGKELIEKFGRGLGTLQLGVFAPIQEIQTHCFNLRELVLNELDEDFIQGSNNNNSNLWQHLGTTLESLSVEFFFPCTEEIKKIQKFCRKLKTIHIDQPAYDRDDYDSDEEEIDGNIALSEALTSYGDQLESASVKNMSSDQLKLIVNGCPNVKVDLGITDDSLLLTSLKILGSLLNKIKIARHSGHLTEGWNICKNLTEICVLQEYNIGDIRQLIAAPKPILKYIQISLHDDDDTRECMNAIAERTGALEEIDLQCSSPPTGSFGKIVQRNNKSLCRVGIYVRKYTQEPIAQSQKIMTDVVGTFIKSPALRYLQADDPTTSRSILAVKDTCQQNRHRRVCVSVLGVAYLE